MTTFIGMPVTVVDDNEKLLTMSSIILAAIWRPDWLVCTSHDIRLDNYQTTHSAQTHDGSLAQLVATLVRSAKLLYAGPG